MAMRLTAFLKATVLLPSVCCVFLGPRVNANAADGTAVRAQDRVEYSASAEARDLLRNRAVLSARSGDYQSAIDTLGSLLESDPGNAGAFHDLLIVLGWAERDSRVMQLAERLEAETAPVEVLETLAKSSRNIGDFEQSIRWYELTISRAPDSLESHLGLALTYADLGQREKALLTLDSVFIDDRNRSRILSAKAYIHRSDGDFAKAIGVYDEVLANDPDHRDRFRSSMNMESSVSFCPRRPSRSHMLTPAS